MTMQLEVGRKIVKVPMNKIKSSPDANCRGKIQPQDCVQLAARIRAEGLLYPIQIAKLAIPDGDYEYEIIAGFRRFMAHRINNAETIEAEILSDKLSAADKAVINLTENLSRSDLNILQEAAGIERIKRLRSVTNRELAETLNVSQKWIQIRLWAIELEPAIQVDIAKGWLKQQHIEQLHSLPQGEKRYAFVRQVKSAQLSNEKPRVNLGKAKPFSKKVRTRTDIFEMQDHLIESLSGGDIAKLPENARLILQALGWAAGETTDMEMYGTFRAIASKNGLHYELPERALSALQG